MVMQNYSYISFVLIIPLAVFLATGLFGKKFQQFSGILGTAGMLVAACLSYYCAYQYFILGCRGSDCTWQAIIAFKQTWLQFSPSLSIEMGIMLDSISVMMLVVVTTVSLMVHL